MPCYRCGTRQVDPDRGESPWKRGVREERQVLICPGCQTSSDWAADLDRCPACRSLRLVRRLGETECRDCGAVRDSAAAAASPPAATAGRPGHLSPAGIGATVTPAAASGRVPLADGLTVEEGLAREVEAALARVLGRTAGSAARG
jgi:hypothetical protein